MKKVKDLTAEEKAVYDALENAELKKQYLEELKDDNNSADTDDTKDSKDNADNGTDNTSDTTDSNSTISDLHIQDPEKLAETLDNKEKSVQNQKDYEKRKQKEDSQDEESTSPILIIGTLVVVAAFVIWLVKKLGFMDDVATATVEIVEPTANSTANIDSETAQQTSLNL